MRDRGSMLVVFADLDGTLLDRETYCFDAAVLSLERLRSIGARVVLLSSKTQEEVQVWRKTLGISDPFAVENGGAVLAERENPRLVGNVTHNLEGYEVVRFGVPYSALVRALQGAADESDCRVRGFADMTEQEISLCCEMGVEHARRAKIRSYDEPFSLLEGDPNALQIAIRKRGLRLTRGRRFFHITGRNDKADAALLLTEAYQRFGNVHTVGIGDGLNDAGFLNLVEYPVILDSPDAAGLHKRVPRARVFSSGPGGWSAAIPEILDGAG